jgi:DNA repair protein RadC
VSDIGAAGSALSCKACFVAVRPSCPATGQLSGNRTGGSRKLAKTRRPATARDLLWLGGMSAHALQRRLAFHGAPPLADAELLAVLLGSELEIAARLLAQAGGLVGLSRAGIQAVADSTSRAQACRIQAAFELGRRAVDEPLHREDAIQCAADVYRRLRGRLAAQEREELHVLGLDSHNRVIHHFVAGLGTVHQVQVDPRDVFRPLVREAAHSAIVVHNHPSGEPAPSDADAELTTRLRAAGELVGVRLLDHVIVARGGYFAFSNRESLITPEEESAFPTNG